jgi:hypothetical protein
MTLMTVMQMYSSQGGARETNPGTGLDAPWVQSSMNMDRIMCAGLTE